MFILWTSFMMFVSSSILLTNTFFNKSIMWETEIHFSSSLLFNISWVVDYFSLTFSLLVLMISSLIFMFAQYYMNNNTQQFRFNLTLSMFVLSMLMLIFSPNFLIMMIGWDGLGMISFLLIIFYNNHSSNNAGTLTFLMNRLGDMFFITGISLLFFNLSWNFEQSKWISFMTLLILLITGMTKSAQMPFSSWLPNAMAAPTPVSALVHSSTLVTAGIFVFIRFNYSLKIIFLLMFLVACLTLLMAGLMANLEMDSKKMIAFSTLSQLGLMVSSLSMNLIYYCFFHLMTHALFKSALFMLTGINIHNFNNNQDMRNTSNIFTMTKINCVLFLICFLSLMSFPFTSGFFSKDLIIDNSMNSLIVFIMFFVSVMLTIVYSIRFIMINLLFFINSHKSSISFYSNSIFLLLPSWLLSLKALLIGYMMTNMSANLLEFIITSKTWKLVYFFVSLMNIFIAIIFIKPFNIMLNNYFLSNMWYLYYLSNQNLIKTPLKLSNTLLTNLDQGMTEQIPNLIYWTLQKSFYINKSFSSKTMMVNFILVSLVLMNI